MSPHILASVNIEVGVHRTVTVFGFALNIDTIWTTAVAVRKIAAWFTRPVARQTAMYTVFGSPGI